MEPVVIFYRVTGNQFGAQRRAAPGEFATLSLERAMFIADVMVLSLDWQPITAEVTVMDVDGRRGQLTLYVSDWDAIDQTSAFARIQLAQMLEWEIFWEESA